MKIDGKPPRINLTEIAVISLIGRIAPPLTRGSAYRLGQDGGLRVLPGSGGITLSHRIGDRCVGLAADHLEPAVSFRAVDQGVESTKGAANRALNVLACVGNKVEIVSGPATGTLGVVTGKHGGVANVMADFPVKAMRRLRIGDMIRVTSCGQGMRLRDFDQVTVMNASPDLLTRWGVLVRGGRLSVPVTHMVPSALMGSGLGKSSAARGDYDIQLFDDDIVRRFRLASLRFGDMVAIMDAAGRFGRSFMRGQVTVGVVVHSDSTVAGHGPGVTTLLAGPVNEIAVEHDPEANLAKILEIRRLARPKIERTFVRRTPHLAPVGSIRSGRRLST
ncbi:DUF4438 domain-containing protein [uncultured Jannaschia sp.]|uniref:DUF4438 domain-containing protein n=1 Tax=uncultured Jannaschia sp. TaxID=293347 RepID=UPI00262F3C7E|nr:DUF4438 domain-containing protein [uncultured Jannaschia sp.]